MNVAGTRTVSSKAGMPPGTLIHIGEAKAEGSVISVIDYDEGHFFEKENVSFSEASALAGGPSVTWINVDGLVDTNVIESFGKAFGLHPLTQEDILNTTQRPKLEEFDEYLYLVVKMLFINADEEVCAEQVSLILGDRLVISFQEQKGDVFDTIRTRLRTGKGRIRKSGADYLLYSMLDAIVDGYFGVFERVGEWIEGLEDELIDNPSPATLETIYSLRRDLIFLRRSIWPLRDVVGALGRGDSRLVQEQTLVFIKDIYDHVIQVADTIETYRDTVAGMLDIYLSSVSNRMNEIMKVLTIIATIFIPLTFVVGLYGMNFQYMPELGWEFGYPAVLVVMALIAAVEIIYFRKKRWI
ncbi:MAG: magnesium/cobalt transporter CorA [Methanomicrobiales archaeon]|nr:magnesium/cobalt transporter CorA [Methanomicrobiales archaeon]